jgi:hypothetical protein
MAYVPGSKGLLALAVEEGRKSYALRAAVMGLYQRRVFLFQFLSYP